jgi:hypothetical protein
MCIAVSEEEGPSGRGRDQEVLLYMFSAVQSETFRVL